MHSSESIMDLNLQQWLSLLEARHPSEIDLGLDRIRVVAEALNCLHFRCPIALVAGTNGKGSCVEMLKQLALSKNLKVGTYTSPHLLTFNERICIDGMPVSDQVLVAAFVKVEQARVKSFFKGAPVSLTYFEFTTLAALSIFQKAHLHCLILEVGLGGRLDAVNIVEPTVSVITSIGIDHEAWLGRDRATIALEKAGIARAQKICVVGEDNPPEGLLENLLQKQARILLIERDFHYQQKASMCLFQLRNAENKTLSFQLNQEPSLALQNSVTAVQTFLALGYDLTENEITRAFKCAHLPGRCEIFPPTNHSPAIICDLAHNPAGVIFFKKQVEALLQKNFFKFPSDKNINLANIKMAFVVGVMADKDFVGMIEAFLDWDEMIDSWFCCDLALPRAAKAQDLGRQVQTRFAGKVFCESSPERALQNARQAGVDLILVFGSFYTLAPIYPLLTQ